MWWRHNIRAKLTLSARQRLRKESVGEEVLHVPFRCAFGLPGPENPTGPPFISVQLGLNEMAEIELVVGRQARDGTRVLAVATTHIRAAGQGPVVPGTLAEAVQPFGTVRLSPGPFTDNGPLVATGELVGTVGARSRYVLGRALRHLPLVEDLILMRVQHDVVDPRLLIHETVPIINHILESVVNHHGGVTIAVTDGAPTIVVKLLDGIEV